MILLYSTIMYLKFILFLGLTSGCTGKTFYFIFVKERKNFFIFYYNNNF